LPVVDKIDIEIKSAIAMAILGLIILILLLIGFNIAYGNISRAEQAIYLGIVILFILVLYLSEQKKKEEKGFKQA